jgi:hypothetical protein
MSEQDQKAFKMYGKIPGKNLLTKMQKVRRFGLISPTYADVQDRKYFDSGDYMMSKAGVASAQAPGTAIPTPEGYVPRTHSIIPADLIESPTHLPH